MKASRVGELTVTSNKVVIPGLDPGTHASARQPPLHERLDERHTDILYRAGGSGDLEWVSGSGPGMTP